MGDKIMDEIDPQSELYQTSPEAKPHRIFPGSSSSVGGECKFPQ